MKIIDCDFSAPDGICKRCGFQGFDGLRHNCVVVFDERPPRFLPGDILRLIIEYATGGRVTHGIDCERFRQRMNSWGWAGCWKHRAEIAGRIKTQAIKEGYRGDAISIALRAAYGAAVLVVKKVFPHLNLPHLLALRFVNADRDAQATKPR
jgi:hypothetical protein